MSKIDSVHPIFVNGYILRLILHVWADFYIDLTGSWGEIVVWILAIYVINIITWCLLAHELGRSFLVSLRHTTGEVSQMPVRCKDSYNVWTSAISVGQHRSLSWLKFLQLGALGRPNAVHCSRLKGEIVEGSW